MLPVRWALTSELESNELSPSELAQIAAAVDLQLTRDVPKHWPVVATMHAFPDPHAVPHGYSPCRVVGMSWMPSGALGFHYTHDREPAARVGFDPNDRVGLATTVSHEAIEGAVDPSGNRKVVCTVPTADGPVRARVLVEAADPPEAYTYNVDGLPVSDFVTQDYYGPHRWKHPAPDVAPQPITRPFSFCGYVTAPLSLARGGYLSFVRPDGTWEQLTWFSGPAPEVRTLGLRAEGDYVPDRQWVDQRSAELAREQLGVVRQ